MRIPLTPERLKAAPARLKEVPALALRAVFTGMDQALVITERVRRRAFRENQATAGAAPATHPVPVATNGTATAQAEPTAQTPAEPPAQTPAEPPAGPATRASRAVKVKTAASRTDAAKASPRKAASSTAKAAASTAKTSTAKTGTAKTGTAKTGTAAKTSASKPRARAAATTRQPKPRSTEPKPSAAKRPSVLPIANYSELSMASLRARLRALDAGQVRELIKYEQTHEDRANIIAMFERRLAKLQLDGTGGGTGATAG